jgi:hypothetical protein
MKTNQMLIDKLNQLLVDYEGYASDVIYYTLHHLEKNSILADDIIYTDVIIDILFSYITEEDEVMLGPINLACKLEEQGWLCQQLKPLLVK